MLKKREDINRLFEKDIDFDVQNMPILKTRKQSSRMRIVRCSGRLGGVSEGVCLCPGCVCVRGVCVSGECPGVCVSQHPMGQTPPQLVDRFLDTRLRKHYLSATTVADDNKKSLIWKQDEWNHLSDYVTLQCFKRTTSLQASKENILTCLAVPEHPLSHSWITYILCQV